MSNFIAMGNLGKHYTNNTKTDLDNNQMKKQKMSDREALRIAGRAKREAREARFNTRVEKNITPEAEMEILEQNPMKDIDVKQVVKNAKANTGVLARKYGLKSPDNEEALTHDRIHCMCCDRKLDNPNAGGNDPLKDDSEIRLMCCWCFGKMSDSDIKSTMYTGMKASAEIRLKVYNPEESTKAEIESLIESKMIQMKVKLRRWEQNVALVGNVKHDTLADVDYLEFGVRNMAPTRYDACTL